MASAAATNANEDAATPKTAPSTSLRDVGSAFLPCCPSDPDPDPDPGTLVMCSPCCCCCCCGRDVVTPPSRIDSRAPAEGGERASAEAPPTRAATSITPTRYLVRFYNEKYTKKFTIKNSSMCGFGGGELEVVDDGSRKYLSYVRCIHTRMFV